MQFKDAMLFQAKIYQTQNNRMANFLKAYTESDVTAENPVLANGTIKKNLDAMITNAIFTINSVALSCIDKAAHAAEYIDGEQPGPFGPMPHPRSYADAPIEEVVGVLLALSDKFVKIYSECDEAELTSREGIPPYDFGSKCFCLAFQLRGEILAALRAKGAELSPEGLLDGPLTD